MLVINQAHKVGTDEFLVGLIDTTLVINWDVHDYLKAHLVGLIYTTLVINMSVGTSPTISPGFNIHYVSYKCYSSIFNCLR